MEQKEIILRLKQLAQLLDDGILTQEEFDEEKHKVLTANQNNNYSPAVESSSPPIHSEVHTPKEKQSGRSRLILGVVIAVAFSAVAYLIIGIVSSVNTKSDETVSTAPARQDGEEPIRQQLVSLVNHWCECHTQGDIDELSSLYAQQVKYYQSDYSLERVVASKNKLFSKTGDFPMSAEDFRLDNHGDGTYKVFFMKNAASKQYPSYLSFCKTGNKWLITEESDFVSDRNIAKRRSKNLTALPDKQVTQNGQIDKMQKEWNFIWDFYEHILMIKEDDWDVTDYISSSLAKRLWTEDYDGCYQVWVFRTGVNGGTGGSKIMAVKPTGKDGWYEVKYIDEGTPGKTSVHIANGLIDDYVAFDRDLQF